MKFFHVFFSFATTLSSCLVGLATITTTTTTISTLSLLHVCKMVDAFSTIPTKRTTKTKTTTIKTTSSLLLLSSSSTASIDQQQQNHETKKDTGRFKFERLDASKFRHPLDRDLTSFLQTATTGTGTGGIGLPFPSSSSSSSSSSILEDGIRRVISIVEQGVRLDLLSSSVKVSSKQLPELYHLLEEACRIIDLPGPTPELYIQSNPQANAYTLAFLNKEHQNEGKQQNMKTNKNKNSRDSSTQSPPPPPPIIVVTSALLERCTGPEIQAILGHELGHLKCEHSIYLTLGGILTAPLRNLPFFVIGSGTITKLVESILEQWRLAAEYSCDRAALLVAQDVNIVNSAMLKLVSGTSNNKYYNTNDSMNVDAFVAQCAEYDKLLKSANPIIRASIEQQQRTHPLPVKRVVELIKWSKSNDYAGILYNYGRPLMEETTTTTTTMNTTIDNNANIDNE